MMRTLPYPLLLILSLFLLLSACGGQSAESENQTSAPGNNADARMQQADTTQQENSDSQVRIAPGHIVMMVSDLDRTQQFYEEHLDFHTTEEVVYDGLRRIFMSASENHHELVLLESRVDEFPPVDHRQLQQVAFEVPSHDILVEYYNHIKETDIPYVVMDNQVGLSLYFSDPDDVTVEIYWDISDQPFGEKMWNGNQETITEEEFLNPFENL